MIEIKAVPGKLIMLGKQGENLAREVIFDVSGVRAEFGDGTFRLSAKRPGEADAYPATVTETGDTVVWALTGADTQNAGRGQCELTYYAGETRLKTWTYDTAIAKSLTGSPKTDPYDEFLDEVNRLAAEAAISQREAKNSENAAKNSEENAKASEGAAKTSEDNAAEYATEKAAEIADSAAQIATNTENIGKNATGIKTNTTDIDILRRENTELRAKTDALWKLSEGKNYDFVEDSAEAYSKNVPFGCRFAQVEKIGGKTVMWNQLRLPMDGTFSTGVGLTRTHTGLTTKIVGTFKLPSTGDKSIYLGAEAQINLAQGHKYIIASVGGTLYGIYPFGTNISVIYNDRTNAIFICTTSGKGVWCFSPKNAVALVDGTAVNEAITVYAIDLTQLFGSGNEPTTADDPRIAEIIAYAEKHPAYNAGELVSAGVEDVEVQGANLLDPKKTTTAGGMPYGLTVTMTGENTFRISGVPSDEVTSAGNWAFAIASNSQKELRGRGLKITAFSIKGSTYIAWGLRTADEPYLAVSVPLTPKVDTDIELRFMVSTATPSAYSPYSLDTYPIPDAVKALPGYGWSAGSICNEIIRRADGWDYIQRVGLPATTEGYTKLDTPTTTDITDLMTGALPLMVTEPGGTITMHHAADDGLTLDVPNTVKYIRDLKEVASSGTE